MAKKLAFDKVLFTTVVLLLVFGLVMVYSASAALARDNGGDLQPLPGQAGGRRRPRARGDGRRHARRLPAAAPPAVVYGLLGGVLALLVAVLFQPELNGTRRWFFVGGVSLQPSELAKLA